MFVDEVCGNDLFCRFDLIVTERTDIANSTLEESHNVELVSNLSYPGIECNYFNNYNIVIITYYINAYFNSAVCSCVHKWSVHCKQHMCLLNWLHW